MLHLHTFADKSGPEVENCPDDLPVLIDEQYETITWSDPIFTDSDDTVVEGFSNYNAGGKYRGLLLNASRRNHHYHCSNQALIAIRIKPPITI